MWHVTSSYLYLLDDTEYDALRRESLRLKNVPHHLCKHSVLSKKCDQYKREEPKAIISAECTLVTADSSALKVSTFSPMYDTITKRLNGRKALLFELSEKDICKSLLHYFIEILKFMTCWRHAF